MLLDLPALHVFISAFSRVTAAQLQVFSYLTFYRSQVIIFLVVVFRRFGCLLPVDGNTVPEAGPAYRAPAEDEKYYAVWR